DEVALLRERELEVVEILARERRDRQRDAGEVHAFVAGDPAALDDRTARPAALYGLDLEPDEPVVDQDLVAGLEHLGDDGRADRELAVARGVARDHVDVLAALEHDRLRKPADAELRPLEVGHDRDRATDLLRHRPDGP